MQLEKEMEEKKRLAEKLEAEKQMMERKVINLKKSPNVPKTKSVSPIGDRKSIIFETPEILECVSENEEEEESYRIDAKKIINKKNIIDDITSDVDNMSRK
jgi:hypothetical protein